MTHKNISLEDLYRRLYWRELTMQRILDNTLDGAGKDFLKENQNKLITKVRWEINLRHEELLAEMVERREDLNGFWEEQNRLDEDENI